MLFQKEGLLIRYVMEDDASIVSKWLMTQQSCGITKDEIIRSL